MRTNRIFHLLITAAILIFSIPITNAAGGIHQQGEDPESRANEIIEQMTPEERVGQLFLVTFLGTNVDSDTQIYKLINNHHVGGVILLTENDNFVTSPNTLEETWSLINQLQVSRYSNSQKNQEINFQELVPPPIYVPLIIGISHEGDGYPNDQILNGLTPLPSLLSIGATWNTDLARQVGALSGKELSSLGINLILGPSLDVIENPFLQGASQLGNRSFGGDPYWVGELGRAYIRGLHEGSKNRMMVVGTHFPGLGSADHVPEDEVATVRKSLEQLKQIELAPFFVVTGNAITTTEKVDALLTSHIRYQGLQGNIRSTTRPIGFDQQALSLLMELPEFASWREDGGVMISDNLGSRAVRRFYDPTEQEFNARRLALDALLAGNDLLYLNNFIETEDPDTFTTITRTIEFFTQKYLEDPLFAERVNQSVIRILSKKYQLYEDFNLGQVLTSGNLNEIGDSSQITYDVAQKGVTLISPTIEELDTVLPEIPARNDFIVYITDDYSVKQCSNCVDQSVLNVDALTQAVINLYGPQSGGLVSRYYQRPYSFTQLVGLLNDEGDINAISYDLERTKWIVFLMQDIVNDRPQSIAIKRFLSERPDLITDKRIIVFAANGPNYLDSTDISKLTAYYGLFSKSTPFIDIAARVLFKEIAIPSGSLPVSVPGIGYDLILATSPNPDQEIELILDIPGLHDSTEPSQSDNYKHPTYRIGDNIPLTTGVIIDANNNSVPNNTPIQFVFTMNGEEVPSYSTTTVNGTAHNEFLIEQSGTLVIQVVSGLALSNELVFEIPVEKPELTQTPTVTQPNLPTSEPTSTSPPPTPFIEVEQITTDTEVGIEYWLGAIVISAFIGWGASRTGALLGRVRWGVQWGLSAFIGGLLLYTYYILELPGSIFIKSLSDIWGFLFSTLLGAIIGWGTALIIIRSQNKTSNRT
jgi:beta-N-acetylhexosaminidase